MKNKYIKITAKSDICAASGLSFAGIIDTDINYDKYGIPFIPGRRIKGCLRDVAEKVLFTVIDDATDIFGKAGQDRTSSLYVGNAYIENYKMIAKELQQARASEKYKDCVLPQKVLNHFTHVVAQTSINSETGIADDGSLRYTRVVNHHSPINEQEIVFYAPISFNEKDEEAVKQTVLGLRNIGLKRNRGMGSVRCELVETMPGEVANKAVWNTPSINNDEDYVINYVIMNDAPLVLSNNEENASTKYINGGSIVGALAHNYFENGGNADSQEFKELFLNGITKYTNLYISREDGDYYPAPEYINRLKKTKEIVNAFSYESKDTGNRPKKLSEKYVLIADNKVTVCEPEMEVIYHHRRESKEQTQQLYSHEVISSNQFFSGKIFTKGKYIDAIKRILDVISIGKSRTAQYGRCSLVSAQIVKASETVTKTSFERGDKCLVTLLSDAIFLNENGYTIYGDDTKKILAKDLGIQNDSENIACHDKLQTKIIYGYNSIWNMRKEPVPAIRAGGCFVFDIKEPINIDSFAFVGEKNQEGFGFAKIEKLYLGEYKEQKQEDKNESEEFAPVLTKTILDSLKIEEELLSINRAGKEISKITASALGRVTLMFKESVAKYPDDSEKAFENLGERIDSIKQKPVRLSISRAILEQYGKYVDGAWKLKTEAIEVWIQKLQHQLTLAKYDKKLSKK